MEERVLFVLRALVGDIGILVVDCFCSNGSLCHLTRIALYSAIHPLPYLPTTSEITTIGYAEYDESMSLLLLPQEEIEDAACCEAEPWVHINCIVFDGKDLGA